MKVGVQDVVFPQLHPLAGLRFLDFDNHVRVVEHFRSAVGDLSTGNHIGRIVGADPGTRIGFNQNLMALTHILTNRFRRKPDTEFIVLDLFWYTQLHIASSSNYR